MERAVDLVNNISVLIYLSAHVYGVFIFKVNIAF